MEKFSQRETVLLDYSPGKSFSKSGSSRGGSNSDVDYADVFGGPPRRNSLIRHSYGDTRGEEEAGTSSDPFRSEKPVFGDEMANRRRFTGEDFFDDIFRGNESHNSSPRKRSGDSSLFSYPGSRISSPVQILSPKAQSIGSVLPAQSSLQPFGSSTRNQNKNRESPNASSYCSHSPLSKSFNHENLNDEEKKENFGSSQAAEDGGEPMRWSSQFHFSIYKWGSKGAPLMMPIMRQHTLRLKEKTKIDNIDLMKLLKEEVEKDLLGVEDTTFPVFQSEIFDNRNPAGDMDLENVAADLVSCQTEEKTMADFLSEIESISKSEIAMPPVASEAENVVVLKQEAVKEQTKKSAVTDEVDKGEKKSGKTSTQDSPLSRGKTSVKGKIKDFVRKFNQETSPKLNSKKETSPKIKREVDSHRQKSELKQESTIRKENETDASESRLDDIVKLSNKRDKKKPVPDVFVMVDVPAKPSVKQYSNTNTKSMSRGESLQAESLKPSSVTAKPSVRKDSNTKTKINSMSSGESWQEESLKSSTETAKSSVKKDSNTKTNTNSMSRGDSPQEESLKSSTVTAKPSVKKDLNTKSNTNSMSSGESWQEESLKSSTVTAKPSVKKDSNTKTNTNSMSRGETRQEERLNPSTAPVPPAEDIDEPIHINFQIKELMEEETEPPKTSPDAEEIQATDAKIRKWFSGKEGNIRALLSTLQYVLWPESGWKPVPLVNIIEGGAVKRSYQRALLYLHPDKLQQKGASSHQKYIAEKVFEILQEAWDHFNSLSSLN